MAMSSPSRVGREGLVDPGGKTSSVMFDFSKRPWPLVFVAESVTDRGSFAQGSHCSGEFVFSFTGLMQVATIAEQYISPPPGHGIWLPPHVVHSAMNLYETCFCSVFIDENWCSPMPSQVSILGVNPLLLQCFFVHRHVSTNDRHDSGLLTYYRLNRRILSEPITQITPRSTSSVPTKKLIRNGSPSSKTPSVTPKTGESNVRTPRRAASYRLSKANQTM